MKPPSSFRLLNITPSEPTRVGIRSATGAAELAVCAPAISSINCDLGEVDAVELPPPAALVRTFGLMLPDGTALQQRRLDAIQPAAIPPAEAYGLANQIAGSESGAASKPTGVQPEHDPSGRNTRVAPPMDVVKLRDRLSYWLQPPLEALLESANLSLPFRPFDYQLDGVAFLYPRHEAVLADEMGLGKTMQTIVTLRLLMHQGCVKRSLLICPKPLISNWQRELSAWAPDVAVTVVEGDERRRKWLWRNVTVGMLIVNYELLVRDAPEATDRDAPFDLVVLDEAQRIKNSRSAAHAAVCNTPRVRSWALTGTPIENSVDDLRGIFQFVSPGRMRPQMPLPTVRSAIRDHVLRRTKEDVLSDLPPRCFRDAELPLTPAQQTAYAQAEDEGVVYLRELGEHVAVQHVFQLVTRLKQICNFDPETGASAKMERLEADLGECAASGRKAIVFSQWVDTLQQIGAHLTAFHPLQYHGRISASKRDAIVQQFRDDENASVLLMSYGAGGVGLNLQFANYVFLFDRWWNPAVEDQAINRAHRIGVVGPVTVTRFLTLGTIEERIDSLLKEKRLRFDEVFGDPESAIEASSHGLSREEILGLFRLAPRAAG